MTRYCFQIRVLRHLEQVVLNGIDYVTAKDMLLTKIVMRTMPLRKKKTCFVSFIVESRGRVIYDHAKSVGFARLDRLSAGNEEWSFMTGKHGVVVRGDIYVRFYEFDDLPVTDVMLHGDVGLGGQTIKYGQIAGRLLCFVSLHTGPSLF